MKNLFILLCFLVYLLSFIVDTRHLGFQAGSPLVHTRFTYMFAHVAFLHLFMNMLSFHFLFRLLQTKMNKYVLFAAMILGAFLATFGAEMPQPTIGASGVVMFLFGCYVVLFPSKNLAIYLVILVGVNLLTYFYAHTNVFIHAFAMLYGILFTLIYLFYERNKILRSSRKRARGCS